MNFPEQKPIFRSVSCKNHPQAEVEHDINGGYIICSQCGLVIADRIVDASSEWRTFKDDSASKNNSRVGESENLITGEHDLSTRVQGGKLGNGSIRCNNKISSGQKLLQESRAYMEKLASILHITGNTVASALHLLQTIKKKNALKGKDKESVMAACLYFECVATNQMRTLKEFINSTGLDKRTFANVAKFIKKMIEEEQPSTNPKIEESIPRFCATLNLDPAVRHKATAIYKMAKERSYGGGVSPVTLISAAIYLAAEFAGNKKSHEEISRVTTMAENTIKICLRRLAPFKDELLSAQE